MSAVQLELLDVDDDPLRLWYVRSHQTSSDVTKDAYDDAIRDLKREFAAKPEALAWINAKTSFREVLVEVEKAEHAYRSQHNEDRALPHLRKISSSIMVYSRVFDMLAQHHAEYVSLAWGALKFVLIGVLNHEKLVTRFAATLVEIADVLPRAEFISVLYCTDRVKAVLSKIYANVLLFLRQAVKWYARSSVTRAIYSTFKPFDLECGGIIEQISASVNVIKDEASLASMAEVRRLHVERQHDGQRLVRIEHNIVALNERMVEVHSNSFATIKQLHTSNAMLSDVHGDTQEISGKLTDVRLTVNDIQARSKRYKNALKILAPATLPETTLHKIRSFSRRSPTSSGRFSQDVELVRRVGDWALSTSPPLLVLHVEPLLQARAREWAAELIASLEPNKVSRVCWYLRTDHGQKGSVSRVDLLRSLIYQLMTISKGKGLEDLNIEELNTVSTEREWLKLVSSALRHVSKCYFIIEANGLVPSLESGPETANDSVAFLEKVIQVCRLNTCDMRLLLISISKDIADAAEESHLGSIAKMRWSAPPPPHLKRLAIRSKARSSSFIEIRQRILKERDN